MSNIQGSGNNVVLPPVRRYLSKDGQTRSRVHRDWAADGVSSFFTATFAPIVQKNAAGMDALYFPIIPSYNPKRDLLQYKAPGGDDGQNDEYPAECAVREWGEEVMRDWSKVELPMNAIQLIHFVDRPDERFVGGKHRKSFWMLPLRRFHNYTNHKRHFRVVDIEDGEDVLHPVQMIEASELAGRGPRCIYKSHLHALAMVLRKLAEIDVVYDVLPDGLVQWSNLHDHVVRGQPVYFNN